jgi:hypothetical protein
MSRQPDPASERASTSEPGGSWSGNGTHDGTSATAVAAPDTDVTAAEGTESTEATAATDETAPTADAGDAVGSAEETVASADEAVDAGDEAIASADAEVVDAARAETDAAAEAATDAAAEPSADQPSTSPDDAGAFLGELVRAMRTTVGTERTRIAADIERRRSEHLAAIQARRETEAQKMHELAADDLKAIDGWADDERQRIQRERERRATELSDDLKKSLEEHGSRIDREVEGVEAAIAAHRVEVDAFFAELDRESDPVAIAQRAGQRPVFPTLDATGGADAAPASETSATTPGGAAEPAPVAVMDADSGAKAATPFGWNRPSSAPAATADTSSDAGAPIDAADPEAQVAAAGDATGAAAAAGTILHAVPSGRPLGWLRRSNDTSDHPNG